MTTITKPGDIAAALDRAAAAIPILETVPLGDPWAAADAEASRAVAEVIALSRAAIIPPEIRPVEYDVIRHFEFLLKGADLTAHVEHLADLHARSLDAYPELAEFVRSPGVLARVRRVAASLAPRVARASEDVARDHEDRFFLLIAAPLQGVEEFEPAASVLAVDGPAFQSRLEAARQRHEDHARAEVERVRLEAEAVDQAVADSERARRADLATFFGARPAGFFNVGGRIFTGAGVASIARGEAARDVIDQYFGTAPLEALERLRLETEAAEAVTSPAV